MALTDYTDGDSIRAVLGVSVDEIDDAVIALPMWWTFLQEGLLDMSADLPAVYATIKVIVSPTDEQARFLSLTQTFSAYLVASKMLGQLPLFSPQTMKGVKDQFTRIANPFDNLKTEVSGGFSYTKSRLLIALQTVNPSDIAPTPVVRVWGVSTGVAPDPVTDC